ncbi:MAG: OsmC family protein [Anaerolineales bacterium]|jgi:putative redox protein|uniref:OsmC family protein n=1 Tax=Candidatus Villigracilis proximus TaxID=3140683 RepID=UPI003136F48C|nr:OsmC family protein [Anaerolineales bacterium]MBK8824393.1 OsmC family protein [Anaerolineales bacterium]MBK9211230.1 OsmC family protein [Anaerolineales bacterium]
MASKTVHLNWNPEQQFTLQDNDNYQIIMKKPKGVSASDLLPMSLIGCASHDVVSILEKQRLQIHSLKVTAEATQDDTPPWRFRKIHVHYQVTGTGIDPEKVGKAILLSEENYCSVYATLRDAIEITHDYEVVEG